MGRQRAFSQRRTQWNIELWGYLIILSPFSGPSGHWFYQDLYRIKLGIKVSRPRAGTPRPWVSLSPSDYMTFHEPMNKQGLPRFLKSPKPSPTRRKAHNCLWVGTNTVWRSKQRKNTVWRNTNGMCIRTAYYGISRAYFTDSRNNYYYRIRPNGKKLHSTNI